MKKVFLPKNFKSESKPNAGFFELDNYIQSAINDGGIVGTALPLGVTSYSDNATITVAKSSGSIFTTSANNKTLTLAANIPVGTTYKFTNTGSSMYILPTSGITIDFYSNISNAYVSATSTDAILFQNASGPLILTKVSSTLWEADYNAINAILTSQD